MVGKHTREGGKTPVRDRATQQQQKEEKEKRKQIVAENEGEAG
jgi:hypothetical protein